MDRWAAGKLPSLERWPSCSRIKLHIDNPDKRTSSRVDLAALSSLPFVGLPANASERIDFLYVTSKWYAFPEWQGEAVVTSLAALLPGLKEFKFHELTGMSCTPLRQYLMYCSLASLKSLVELSLPSSRALDHIGALADRLQTLWVLPARTAVANDSVLTPQGAASLAQLRRLKYLHFGSSILSSSMAALAEAAAKGWPPAPDSTMRLLLDNLPPGLVLVTFRQRLLSRAFSALSWSVSGGRIAKLTVATGGGPPALADGKSCPLSVFADALIGSAAFGQEQEQQQLETIGIDALDVGRGEVLDVPGMAPVWQLLRHCKRLCVGSLHASTAGGALRAVALLGKPEKLVLERCQGQGQGHAAAQGPMRDGDRDKLVLSLRAPGAANASAPWCLSHRQALAQLLRQAEGESPAVAATAPPAGAAAGAASAAPPLCGSFPAPPPEVAERLGRMAEDRMAPALLGLLVGVGGLIGSGVNGGDGSGGGDGDGCGSPGGTAAAPAPPTTAADATDAADAGDGRAGCGSAGTRDAPRRTPAAAASPPMPPGRAADGAGGASQKDGTSGASGATSGLVVVRGSRVASLLRREEPGALRDWVRSLEERAAAAAAATAAAAAGADAADADAGADADGMASEPRDAAQDQAGAGIASAPAAPAAGATLQQGGGPPSPAASSSSSVAAVRPRNDAEAGAVGDGTTSRGAADADADAGRRRLVVSCQGVPSADAVILACVDPQAVAEVEAAAAAEIQAAAAADVASQPHTPSGDAFSKYKLVSPLDWSVWTALTRSVEDKAAAGAERVQGEKGQRERGLVRRVVLQALEQLLQGEWSRLVPERCWEPHGELAVLASLLRCWEMVAETMPAEAVL